MTKNIGNYLGFSAEPNTGGGSGSFNIFEQSYFKRLGEWQTFGGITFSPGAGVTSTEAVYNDNLYTFIVVKSPTTMSVDSPTNFDVVVIGGGGGTHAGLDSPSPTNPPGYSGGGGAGGVAISTGALFTQATGYTITIGNGGPAGSPWPFTPKSQVPGSPSSIVGTGINITGVGGGGGGNPAIGGGPGGSGGGSAYPPSATAGSATQPGQPQTSPTPVGRYGHPGGPGFGGGSHHAGSGGGGAGGAGQWTDSSPGGAGGPGIAITGFTISQLGPIMPAPWATAVGPTGLYAGGGGGTGTGGGPPGPGGGGQGSVSTTGGTGGVDHTGGGGGGGRNVGGKGVVLLRAPGAFNITLT